MSAALRSVPRGEESRCRAIRPLTPVRNALADERLGAEAADAADRDEAEVVDVGRDHADLVDVADERAVRAAARARDAREARAERVAHTSANGAAAARQTAVARSSEPEGAGAVSRSWSSGGMDTAAEPS